MFRKQETCRELLVQASLADPMEESSRYVSVPMGVLYGLAVSVLSSLISVLGSALACLGGVIFGMAVLQDFSGEAIAACMAFLAVLMALPLFSSRSRFREAIKRRKTLGREPWRALVQLLSRIEPHVDRKELVDFLVIDEEGADWSWQVAIPQEDGSQWILGVQRSEGLVSSYRMEWWHTRGGERWGERSTSWTQEPDGFWLEEGLGSSGSAMRSARKEKRRVQDPVMEMARRVGFSLTEKSLVAQQDSSLVVVPRRIQEREPPEEGSASVQQEMLEDVVSGSSLGSRLWKHHGGFLGFLSVPMVLFLFWGILLFGAVVSWAEGLNNDTAIAGAWSIFSMMVLLWGMFRSIPPLPRFRSIAVEKLSVPERLKWNGESLYFEHRGVSLDKIVLSEPFAVRGFETGAGRTLGVEIEQTEKGRTLRFCIPLEGIHQRVDLPRLDMDAPVIDGESFLQEIWPAIAFYSELHGHVLPWSVERQVHTDVHQAERAFQKEVIQSVL